MTSNDYDILIIGGGLVGASLACALGNQPGLRIGLIEAAPWAAAAPSMPVTASAACMAALQLPATAALVHPGTAQDEGCPEPPASIPSSYDDRSIALAYGTRRIFEGMGLWPLLADSTSPIKKIHVSDRGHAGVTRLDCADEGVDAMGYVVVSRVLGQMLARALRNVPNVDLICPALLTGIAINSSGAQIVIDQAGTQRTLTAQLVVAADGGKSSVRERLGIASTTWDYHQTAIITNITPQYHHNQTAYERFTENGPLAMLPMNDSRCAVVWTVASGQAANIMRMDDDEFRHGLQTAFGYRLGKLQKVGMRHAYPLALTAAREHVRPHLAIIGNAAHTLHPIAGQGFNLGLRDVAALAQIVVDARRTGRGIGSMDVLADYADWRRHDQRRAIAFTDSLIRIFTNPLAPFVVGRNLGLVAVDLLPPLKHILARQTMGLVGKLPRLARGLGL